MPDPQPTLSRTRSLPTPGAPRASVIGAGSFGTALAVLLSRGGLRTTLQARTQEQAQALDSKRENVTYLPGVELPPQLRIEPMSAGVAKADYVFLAVPSKEIGGALQMLDHSGLGKRTAVVSVAKGLVPPGGDAPTTVLALTLEGHRIACIGGPAHAQEMVRSGAGLVVASRSEDLARDLAQVFTRAGVVCEQSQTIRSESSSRVPRRTRPRLRPAPPKHRDQTRPAPRPGTSSPRSGATPSNWARDPSR